MAKNNKNNSQPVPSFDISVLNVQAQAASSTLLEIPHEQQEALVNAWVKNSNASAVHAITENESISPAIRKIARRGLAVLKSRGVSLPQEPPKTSHVFSKPESSFEARTMFPDGDGSQIWWVIKSSPLGEYEVVEVTTNDRGGLADAKHAYPKGGSLRQIWHSFFERVGRYPVSVPVVYAHHRIAQAYQIMLAQKAIMPLAVSSAGDLLGDLNLNTPVAHPIESAQLSIPTDEATIESRLQQSMLLHQLPEFASWLPESSAGIQMMQSIDEKFEELKNQKLEDDQLQTNLRETMRQATQDAVDAYFNDERKKLYIARLHDSAWSLKQANETESAIDALLIANAIRHAGIVSNQPSSVPFLLGLFVKFVVRVQEHLKNSGQSNEITN